MTTLFPYQVEGARFLATRKRALLADEMGLGKSAQAIAACDELGAREVRVLCPASVRENWRREFRKFSRTGIMPEVIAYSDISADKAAWLPVDVLIVDESHYLKEAGSKRTAAVYGKGCKGEDGLVFAAEHVFCLTGTPTPNHYGELWPMMRALFPDAIIGKSERPMARTSFETKFCRMRHTGFDYKIVGSRNHEDLKRRLGPHTLRRKKAEVLPELPPIRFDTLALVTATSSHGFEELVQLYDQHDLIERTLAEKGVAGLREIAPHVAQLRRLTGLAKAAPAVEWINDWLEACDDKLVVFCQHLDVIDATAKGVEAGGHQWTAIYGAMSAADRQNSIDTFQCEGDVRVFIGQIQAAGTGITLTAASDALFVESSWVPADNEQAAMRIHRIGQRNACLVRFAMLAGSIDEQVQRAVCRKAEDIAKLFS